MHSSVPPGSRAAARVLLSSERNRLLLFHAEASPGGDRWWVAPGGGRHAGEGFEAAAQRELHEETGLLLPIGPWVWTRRHVFLWEGRRHDQYERYFVARSEECPLVPVRPDSYVVGHRWWGLDELLGAADDFAPRRLPILFAPIVSGHYPDPAIDCGV